MSWYVPHCEFITKRVHFQRGLIERCDEGFEVVPRIAFKLLEFNGRKHEIQAELVLRKTYR